MSYISDKVAYLKGFADGAELEKGHNGKILREIIDVLGAIAEQLDDLEENISDLADCVDDIYDILSLDDIDIDEEDEDYDDDLGDEEVNEDEFLETVCPSCGGTIFFDEDMIDSDDGLICPHCNEPVEIKICPEDGCGSCEEEDCDARE